MRYSKRKKIWGKDRYEIFKEDKNLGKTTGFEIFIEERNLGGKDWY